MHNPVSPGDSGRECDSLLVIPYESGHLTLLAWRDFDRRYTLTLPNFEGIMETINGSGSVGLSVMHKGILVACGGVVPAAANGTGYCWLFGSVYLQDVALGFTREVRKWLDVVMKDMQLHRLYTVCVAEDKQGRDWVKLLGFEEEGTMRQYDIYRSDYIMMGRVKDRPTKVEGEGATDGR